MDHSTSPSDNDDDQTATILPSVSGPGFGTFKSVNNMEAYTSSLIIPELKVYKRRWYMIFVFSTFSMIQCSVWNTWGPVAHPAMVVFDWREEDIAMMGNYGCIMIVTFMFAFMWLMVEKGLRYSMLIATTLTAVGTAMRCITMENPYATVVMHVASLMNGIAGPLAQGGCTLVSVTWFPPNERITATSIANAMNYFGAGLSFLIGPLIVRDIQPPINATEPTDEEIAVMKNEIHTMLITYAVMGGVVFLTTFIYFPNKPPIPPSVTAQCLRSQSFIRGVKQLMTKPNFWLLAGVYCLALGIYATWVTVIEVDLRHVGVSQSDAAWLGFYAILSGAIFAFLSARLNDKFARHMKCCMLVLFVGAGGMMGWFAAMAQGLIRLKIFDLYVSVIVGSGCLCGTIPLLFEVCCEFAYPVSEAIASGLQILMFNIIGTIFLTSFFIPNIGVAWMNWLMFGAIVLSIPAVALYKEQYIRLEIDDLMERRRSTFPTTLPGISNPTINF